MKHGGGSQKGATNERKVCRLLSLWVTHGKREDVFWRSAMSGGRATVAKRKGKILASQAGDISAVDEAGHTLTNYFYIETKHVKAIQLDRFIVTQTGPLVKYWKTVQLEARSYNKQPLLIVKQNLLPILFICPFGIASKLTEGRLKRTEALARVYGQHACEIWLFERVLSAPFAYQPD